MTSVLGRVLKKRGKRGEEKRGREKETSRTCHSKAREIVLIPEEFALNYDSHGNPP